MAKGDIVTLGREFFRQSPRATGRFIGRAMLLFFIFYVLGWIVYFIIEGYPLPFGFVLFVVPFLPFILFRKWIIQPNFPYLKWGYIAVFLYTIPLCYFVTWLLPKPTLWRVLKEVGVMMAFMGPVVFIITIIYSILEPRVGLGDKPASAAVEDDGAAPGLG